eukprot:scaffold8522_cov70-Cylindrotheca_fusiformis.AAC.4
MAVSTSEILLEYVCPALGVVFASCMALAPYADLKKAISKGQLGDLNPTPWAFMMGNCFGWIFYAILKEDMWVFASNAPGFIFSFWLNLVAVKLLQQEHYSIELQSSMANYLVLNEQQQKENSYSQKENTNKKTTTNVDFDDFTMPKKEDWSTIIWDITSSHQHQPMTLSPSRHENLLLGLVIVWMMVGSVIALVKDESILSKETTLLLVGLMNNIFLVFFYAAPLSSIQKVLQDRNAASLHVPTMILNTLNSTFWMIYGIAVMDCFIIFPNGLGVGLGVFQIILCFIFRRSTLIPPTNSIGTNLTACFSMESMDDLSTTRPSTDEEAHLVVGDGWLEKPQTYSSIK